MAVTRQQAIADRHGLETLEQLNEVAAFTRRLASDEALAKQYLIDFFAAGKGQGAASVDTLLRLARPTWSQLAVILRLAVPYAWDVDAIRFVCELSTRLPSHEALSQQAVPAPFGWWWGGLPMMHGTPNRACALAWDMNPEGAVVYPLQMIVGGWGPASDDTETVPYRVGPMTLTGIPITFGMTCGAMEQEWPAGVPELVRALLRNHMRLFMSGCSAIALGELTDDVVRLSHADSGRLRSRFPAEWGQAIVRVIGPSAEPPTAFH